MALASEAASVERLVPWLVIDVPIEEMLALLLLTVPRVAVSTPPSPAVPVMVPSAGGRYPSAALMLLLVTAVVPLDVEPSSDSSARIRPPIA